MFAWCILFLLFNVFPCVNFIVIHSFTILKSEITVIYASSMKSVSTFSWTLQRKYFSNFIYSSRDLNSVVVYCILILYVCWDINAPVLCSQYPYRFTDILPVFIGFPFLHLETSIWNCFLSSCGFPLL